MVVLIYVLTNITHLLVLPHKGGKGQKLIKPLSKYVKKVLPKNHLPSMLTEVKTWFLTSTSRTKLN